MFSRDIFKILAYLLVIISTVYSHYSYAEIFRDEINIVRGGWNGAFQSYTREWPSGFHARAFRTNLDVAAFVGNVSRDTCVKREDSGWFNDSSDAEKYCDDNPETKCQSCEAIVKYIRTEQVPKPNCIPDPSSWEDCMESKDIFKWQAKYTWKWWEWQLTYLNGNINSIESRLYGACGYWNPTPWQDLTISKEFRYIYQWDKDKPKCVPALTPDLGNILWGHDFVEDNKIKSAITALGTKWGTSIVHMDWSDWDGHWTNKDLYFRRRCSDDHSGCKGDTAKKWVLEDTKPLANRQTSLKMSWTPYQDNVNNVASDICQVEYQRLSSITRKCSYLNWVPQAWTCSYSAAMTGEVDDPKYPILDDIEPIIDIVPWNASKTVRWNEWSFYAGDINFSVDIKDPAGWGTKNGISGLKNVALFIAKTSSPSSSIGWLEIVAAGIPERIERRKKSSLDSVPSEFNISNGEWRIKILEKGEYIIKAETSDYAGNSKTFEHKFTVVEKFTPNTILSLTQNSHIDNCLSHKTVTGFTDASCFPATTNGWYIRYEVKNKSEELFADATSARKFEFQFYDRYFNEISQKKIKSLQSQWSKCIHRNQVDAPKPNCGDDAVTHQLTDDESKSRYVKPVKWITNSKWEIALRSFSYAPWKFNPNYEWRLCYWDNFWDFDCADAQEKKYSLEWTSQKEDDFYHVFTGALLVWSGSDNRVNLWVENDIAIQYFATNPNDNNAIPNSVQPHSFTVHNFLESLYPDLQNTQRTAITATGIYDPQVSMLTIGIVPVRNNRGSFIIEQINTENSFDNSKPIGITTSPWMSMSLKGKDGISKNVKYYLSEQQNTYWSWISQSHWNLNRIYIGGYKQTVGKDKYVSKQLNIFSEKYDPTKLKELIYKNVSYITRNRKPDGSIVNKIKYASWDKIISEFTDTDKWDILILKNGNLTFDTDFNAEYPNPPYTSKTLVILREKGDISMDKWNIYIKPNVKYIAANIYADGSVMSVDSNSKRFTKSDTSRTLALQNQLVIYGSLFSQNTVWWAVKWSLDAGTSYYRPWPFKTQSKPAIPDNLFWALEYDLSFLRMNNENQDIMRNHNREEPVVIIYDSKMLTNPPAIFNFKK